MRNKNKNKQKEENSKDDYQYKSYYFTAIKQKSLENFEEVKEFIFREHNWLGIITNKKLKPLDNKIPTLISSWKTNYLSWKNRTYPKLILKYEDLHSDTFQNFKKILNFINDFQKTDITDAKIKQTVDLCNIKNLSKLEDSQGFDEKLLNEKKFFRKGLVDEWKSKLEEHQIKKIEEAFYKEMKELKYL